MSLFGDINEVTLLGNITRDPEMKMTPGGTPVMNLSVATNRNFKRGEEWVSEPSFHNVTVWAKTADNLYAWVKKGTRVLVRGRIETSSYESDGIKKYITKIIANDVTLISNYKSKEEQSKTDQVVNVDDIPF